MQVVEPMASALTDVSSDQLLPGQLHIWNLYESVILKIYVWVLQKWWYPCKNTFGVKKVWLSKVESYLEVNALTDWQQKDVISECGQSLAY